MGSNELGQSDVPSGFVANILMISLNARHTCAISSRMLACWGNNNYNHLVVPSHHRTASWVSTNRSHTCALKAGELACWGSDSFGAVTLPQGLQGDRNVKAVISGLMSTCAIDAHNDLTCWGNEKGILAPPELTKDVKLVTS
mmetsp:Transcript_58717/g.49623  ORF Transcript_58717/g.49623 Transcript_58717/m.49623 type:complete len:142 (+) Transcript_58717:117-542(+)